MFDAASTQQSSSELSQQQSEPEAEQEYQAEDGAEPLEAEASSDEPVIDEDGRDEQFTDDAGRKYYNVKPDRMRGFVNAKNFVKSIEEFAPTVEDAKSHYEGASDFRAMQSMFDSAEPESLTQFMDYWQKGSPEAFGSMAQRLPAYLASQASNNPMAAQALGQIEAQVHRVTINRAYDRARETGDRDDFLSAQALDTSRRWKRFPAVSGNLIHSLKCGSANSRLTSAKLSLPTNAGRSLTGTTLVGRGTPSSPAQLMQHSGGPNRHSLLASSKQQNAKQSHRSTNQSRRTLSSIAIRRWKPATSSGIS
jgi:hypothetical protein